MAHGYLGDGYGVRGEFEAGSGDEQSQDARERNWRSQGGGTMFGQDRGWSDSAWRNDDPGLGFSGFAGEPGRRGFSANPDDHYRSWRDRHMSELDRDYEDYCRERELRFHSDFDTWRRQRHSSVEPLRTGMTQTGLSADPTGVTQAEAETSPATPEEPDPMGSATLGTTSRGRGRR